MSNNKTCYFNLEFDFKDFESGYHLDKRNVELNTKKIEMFDDLSEYILVVELYEIYSRENVIKMPLTITPGVLAKQIITGEISEKNIESYVEIFENKFLNFQKPTDVSNKEFLLTELSTNFYRFHANPSIWMYKLDNYIDVNELQCMSKTNVENKNCRIIITKLDNVITKYEIIIKLDFAKIESLYPQWIRTNLEKYQEIKYKLLYNRNLYIVENLSDSLFVVKKKYFYAVKSCTLWGNKIKTITKSENDTSNLTFIEFLLHLPYNMVEI